MGMCMGVGSPIMFQNFPNTVSGCLFLIPVHVHCINCIVYMYIVDCKIKVFTYVKEGLILWIFLCFQVTLVPYGSLNFILLNDCIMYMCQHQYFYVNAFMCMYRLCTVESFHISLSCEATDCFWNISYNTVKLFSSVNCTWLSIICCAFEGKDATAAFDKVGHSADAIKLRETFLVGKLQVSI